MNKDNKKEFKKEYGENRFLFINLYNLWDLHPQCLYDLRCAIDSCLYNRPYNEREKKILNSERFYMDTSGLKNLDAESLIELDKAINLFMFFREENFEDHKVFKKKSYVFKKK